MTKPLQDRLTIEQLKQERCFLDMTPKQQKMIETFITSGGDRIQSVMVAYNAKSPEVARVMAYEFFASPKVVACLTVYFQDDPLDVFKREVQRAYHNKKLSVAQVSAMRMFCDLNGWGSASLPDLHGRDDEPAVPEIATPRTRPPEGSPRPAQDSRIPKSALKTWIGPDGACVGYRDADGTDIQF